MTEKNTMIGKWLKKTVQSQQKDSDPMLLLFQMTQLIPYESDHNPKKKQKPNKSQ